MWKIIDISSSARPKRPWHETCEKSLTASERRTDCQPGSDRGGKRMRALVLGIGNLLWADEGFGVRAVEHFDERYVCGETVSVVDGGTRGMALMPLVQDCDLLIILDAIDFDLAPGTLHLVRDGERLPSRDDANGFKWSEFLDMLLPDIKAMRKLKQVLDLNSEDVELIIKALKCCKKSGQSKPYE
eukprot:gene19881-20385_t